MSTKASDREKRRAAALRANLKRRKQAAGTSASATAQKKADIEAQERPNRAQNGD